MRRPNIKVHGFGTELCNTRAYIQPTSTCLATEIWNATFEKERKRCNHPIWFHPYQLPLLGINDPMECKTSKTPFCTFQNQRPEWPDWMFLSVEKGRRTILSAQDWMFLRREVDKRRSRSNSECITLNQPFCTFRKHPTEWPFGMFLKRKIGEAGLIQSA